MSRKFRILFDINVNQIILMESLFYRVLYIGCDLSMTSANSIQFIDSRQIYPHFIQILVFVMEGYITYSCIHRHTFKREIKRTQKPENSFFHWATRIKINRNLNEKKVGYSWVENDILGPTGAGCGACASQARNPDGRHFRPATPVNSLVDVMVWGTNTKDVEETVTSLMVVTGALPRRISAFSTTSSSDLEDASSGWSCISGVSRITLVSILRLWHRKWIDLNSNAIWWMLTAMVELVGCRRFHPKEPRRHDGGGRRP